MGLAAKSTNPIREIGTNETAQAITATLVALATGTWKMSISANW